MANSARDPVGRTIKTLFPLTYNTYNYSTAQLNLTEKVYSMGSARYIFHFTHVQARLMTSNLLCIALVYALDMCMSGMYTPNLDYMCMQIVSQGQWNKLYKHVHVLRCNPLVIQDLNPVK